LFHIFYVELESRRNYLKFFWFSEEKVVEYQMKVQLFPTCHLRVKTSVATSGNNDVQRFFHNNFYVDIGIVSVSDAKLAQQLTQEAVKTWWLWWTSTLQICF